MRNFEDWYDSDAFKEIISMKLKYRQVELFLMDGGERVGNSIHLLPCAFAENRLLCSPAKYRYFNYCATEGTHLYTR